MRLGLCGDNYRANYLRIMFEMLSSREWRIWVKYKGKVYSYILKLVNSDNDDNQYLLFAQKSVQEFHLHKSDKALHHITLPAQVPLPADFIEELAKVIRQIC